MWGWGTAPSCYNKRNKHGDIKSVNSFPPRQRKYTTFPPLTNWNIIISKYFETFHRSAFEECIFWKRFWSRTIVPSQPIGSLLVALATDTSPFSFSLERALLRSSYSFEINLDSISSPLSGDKNISWLFLTNWRKVNKRTASLDRREQKHRPTQYPNTQEVTNLFSDLFLPLLLFSIQDG